jgi:gamma-glutamylcyclotransferase (GGCT)/AIG2-like uncharacterized protein YtfP
MLYVAYGSNMNLEQMAFRCPNSKVVCNGRLNGWKLVFNIHADVIKGKKKDIVPVVVWDIADEDWDRLDMYEGYPLYYVKKDVEVLLDGGEKEVAVVYVMADNRKGICPPAKNYFECIATGYNDNKIDLKYLYDALDYSYENETRYNQYKVKGMV